MTTPELLAAQLEQRCSWLPAEIAKRWSITYGSRSWRIVEGVQSLSEMGEHLGGGLYSREVDYLCSEEWATKAEDILWRRTKLGLFTTDEEHQKVQAYLNKVAGSMNAIDMTVVTAPLTA
jgi:glycerol-3-phosphate dehydrogenase